MPSSAREVFTERVAPGQMEPPLFVGPRFTIPGLQHLLTAPKAHTAQAVPDPTVPSFVVTNLDCCVARAAPGFNRDRSDHAAGVYSLIGTARRRRLRSADVSAPRLRSQCRTICQTCRRVAALEPGSSRPSLLSETSSAKGCEYTGRLRLPFNETSATLWVKRQSLGVTSAHLKKARVKVAGSEYRRMSPMSDIESRVFVRNC
jgi:hypothetical protein